MVEHGSLKACPLFLDWSPEQLKMLEALCQEKILSPGEILFNQGEASESFYLIRRGTMGIKKFVGDGEEIIASFGTGSHFGELAMLTRNSDIEKRSATAQAIEPSTVLAIPYLSFQKFLKSQPEASALFYRNLSLIHI